MLKNKLKKKRKGLFEKIGVVLSDNSIVTLTNMHDDKANGALLSSEDLFTYFFSGDFETVATWHTHVDTTSDLSGEDYATFLMYPNLTHYIVGTDGVKKYIVERGLVVNG